LSLDQESDNINSSVAIYIKKRVDLIASRRKYSAALKQDICEQLISKAEGTFLWPSLACQRLESISEENPLTAMESLPSGLHNLYSKSFRELKQGHPRLIKLRMHLLKAMLLTFRPVRIDELHSILNENSTYTTMTCIDSCVYFVRRREDDTGSAELIEFQHQSARDYLASIQVYHKGVPATFAGYGHAEIAMNLLNFLDEYLKVNILGLVRPPSAEEIKVALVETRSSGSLSQFRYAAVFWAQHLCSAHSPKPLEDSPQLATLVIDFLMNRVMEWIECLGWLGEMSTATAALRRMQTLMMNATVRSAQNFERLEADEQSIVRGWTIHQVARKRCIQACSSAFPSVVRMSSRGVRFGPHLHARDKSCEEIQRTQNPGMDASFVKSGTGLACHAADI
jgi:hypothetical protein